MHLFLLGSRICVHGKHKAVCKECGGSAICTHQKVKWSCLLCKGVPAKRILNPMGSHKKCIHDRETRDCKECGGHRICTHNKQKYKCAACGYVKKKDRSAIAAATPATSHMNVSNMVATATACSGTSVTLTNANPHHILSPMTQITSECNPIISGVTTATTHSTAGLNEYVMTQPLHAVSESDSAAGTSVVCFNRDIFNTSHNSSDSSGSNIV